MTHPRSLAAPLSRLTGSQFICPRARAGAGTGAAAWLGAAPQRVIRCATTKAAPPKKKKAQNTFTQYDLSRAEQFALVDAMRYIRAFEVGRNPSSSKYELHVRLRTLKNGPVVRNRLRLPHPVKTDIRVCVIAPPGSRAAEEARAAGAALVGEDEIFAQIKEGIVDFDRCICHADSLQKLNKAGLGKILGPRKLMPSTKTGTVVTKVGTAVQEMVGGSEYREKQGVVRMAVGQLGHTAEELQSNVKAFMDMLKKDLAKLNERISKEIHEVVLSSTNAPGFSLNGEFRSANSISPKELSGPM